MPKGLPASWEFYKVNNPYESKLSYKGNVVSICKRTHGESLMFSFNGILFELHKMTKSKKGGVNFRVVAWTYRENHLMQHPGAAVHNSKWKFIAKTNGLVHFHDKEGLVRLALDSLGNYEKTIIKEIM